MRPIPANLNDEEFESLASVASEEELESGKLDDNTWKEFRKHQAKHQKRDHRGLAVEDDDEPN